MDEHTLPENPRDWPTDPFALLGVPRSVGETELKRAYTRLIRKYKPERAPDEFRRIREAYETAVEMSRWYRESPTRDDLPGLPFTPVGPAAAPEPSPRGPVSPVPHQTQIDPPVRPAQLDPAEAAWADAVAGDWPGAYAALVVLADLHPDRADLPLRLYWLLALKPTLDADSTRHAWLARALERARLAGPAAELYARELASDPDGALCPPYFRLLELDGVPAPRLLVVARSRLAAAVAERRWAAVEVDLGALARRADELDEAHWLDHLTDVAGHAAFAQPALAARCAELLAGLRHLELRHAWAFDRFDERQAAARVWREATMVPDPIRRTVAVAWAGGDWRRPLAAAGSWAAADPADALRRCDQATREGLVVLSAFARLVAARREEAVVAEYPPGLVRGLVRAHLTNHAQREYRLMRESLLRFLLAERIDPEELVAACAVDATYAVRSIVNHVREDGALHLIYRAACQGV
ncbi:MAG: J domain-containing protein [Planctomycetes bacterium]|nr:J domain-containing protein [Planctomycetota bacterium]